MRAIGKRDAHERWRDGRGLPGLGAFDIGLYRKRACALAETFGDADSRADALARLDGY